MNNTDKNYLVVSIDSVCVIRSFVSHSDAADYLDSMNLAGRLWGMPPVRWKIVTRSEWERMTE